MRRISKYEILLVELCSLMLVSVTRQTQRLDSVRKPKHPENGHVLLDWSSLSLSLSTVTRCRYSNAILASLLLLQVTWKIRWVTLSSEETFFPNHNNFLSPALSRIPYRCMSGQLRYELDTCWTTSSERYIKQRTPDSIRNVARRYGQT